MEAVKLGSAVVALKNKTHAAIVALKRAPNELSAYQKKIIPVDDHLGFSFSGLLADARILRYNLFSVQFMIYKSQLKVIFKFFQ